MKFTKTKVVPVWNGIKPLPAEINTVQQQQDLAEFELLAVLATLHGVSAFDIMTGAIEGSEKDGHINEVLDAFQSYTAPKMPLSYYTNKDKRIAKKA